MNDMKFMDMVLDETLRLYPQTLRIDRQVTSDYEYNGMILKKGSLLIIPVYALHHDPAIYPEPDTFNPYRFDEEAKKERDTCAYLPFGSGPRNCIGKLNFKGHSGF